MSGQIGSESSAGAPTSPGPEGMPARIGRYRVLLPIASGGMGTVYLAVAEGPLGGDRWVAIKRVHPHLASDPKFVAMFMDEARIISRITHPNVCGLLDYGSGDGEGHWLVMPYLWGEPLQKVRRAAHRSENDALRKSFPFLSARIVELALEGLHAAHELRDEAGRPLEVVHRDISPQNLHVGYDGIVHVLDFGVATARHRLVGTTATGEVKGKFAYMAPEQLDGKKLDRRADVFAMGVVLWESLTGRRLFARDTMSETVKAVLTEPIPSLREHWPEAPLELEEVVGKALARDPEQRYPTARAMARDIALALVELRHVIGVGDVADAMAQLFPGALEQRRAEVEAARQSAIVADATPAPEAERSKITRALRTQRGGEVDDAAPSKAPRSGVPVAWIVAAVATLVGVGGVGLAVTGGLFGGGDGGDGDEAAIDRASEPTVPNAGVDEAPIGSPPAIADRIAAVPPIAEPPADPGPAVEETAVEAIAVDEPVVEAIAVEETAADGDDDARPSRREPARGPGSVSVATPGGWAVVYRGGDRLGDAPGTFTLPAGSHTLEIQPFGRGERIRRRVRVSAGGTARLVVPVSP